MSAMSSCRSGGASACAACSSAVLKEALRRLPEMPRILMTSLMCCSRSWAGGWKGSLLQRSEVDDEAVFHIALQHALVGLVDLLHRNHFDVGDDAMLGAVVEHLLCFLDAADERAAELAALEDQVADLEAGVD